MSAHLPLQQEIRYMHAPDPLVIPASKCIDAQDILRVVVADFQQALIFSALRLFRADFLRDLHIDFLALPFLDKPPTETSAEGGFFISFAVIFLKGR